MGGLRARTREMGRENMGLREEIEVLEQDYERVKGDCEQKINVSPL